MKPGHWLKHPSMVWAMTPPTKPNPVSKLSPFPAGLTPADTAHQQTEQVEGGALIPAQLQEQTSEAGVVRMSGAILKSEAYEPPASEPAPPGQERQIGSLREIAINIAIAAKKLNDLRENWLNPPEWTHKVPEVTPLGMDKVAVPGPHRAQTRHHRGRPQGPAKTHARRISTTPNPPGSPWRTSSLTRRWQRLTAGPTTRRPCPTTRSSSACWR